MPDGEIAINDPRAEDVDALLERHPAFARTNTPAEDIHALDLDGLLDPAIRLYSFRLDGQLLGIGALRQLERHHAEIKSMHTAEGARGRGIARALVDHLVAVARASGVCRVSLETGSTPAFAPARSLYAAAGFEPCGPFAAYGPSPNSTFTTLTLTAEDATP